MSYEYTNKLLEMVEEGILDKDTVIMIIYHVKAWDKPVDYAASSREVSLGLYMTREGAEKKIKEFKKQKDWKAWWDLPTIQEVEVLP